MIRSRSTAPTQRRNTWNAVATGRAEAGARLCGQAERQREEIGSPFPLWERARYDRQIAAGRASLGDDVVFDQALQEGRSMTLEEAIEGALPLLTTPGARAP